VSTVSVPRETEHEPNAPKMHSCVSRETSVTSPDPQIGPFAALALLPVHAYRRFLSPLFAPRCRYYPSCSAYAEQSIQELGAVRGSILAAWRVLRCNPFSDGGFDEVADRRIFRSGGGS
jgi:putative membrane protein insertion efficiency factor